VSSATANQHDLCRHGIDAVLAKFDRDGGAIAMWPLRHVERPWSDEVRAGLHAWLGPTTAARALHQARDRRNA
jgi:hypothetical protein